MLFTNQWKTTVRTELITQPATADDYKVMLCTAIDPYCIKTARAPLCKV